MLCTWLMSPQNWGGHLNPPDGPLRDHPGQIKTHVKTVAHKAVNTKKLHADNRPICHEANTRMPCELKDGNYIVCARQHHLGCETAMPNIFYTCKNTWFVTCAHASLQSDSSLILTSIRIRGGNQSGAAQDARTHEVYSLRPNVPMVGLLTSMLGRTMGPLRVVSFCPPKHKETERGPKRNGFRTFASTPQQLAFNHVQNIFRAVQKNS